MFFWNRWALGARALQGRLDVMAADVPVKLMADIDHGDVTLSNPNDIDPNPWASAVPRVSPIIRIKQSLIDKGGHRPFTVEHNAKGRVTLQRLLAVLAKGVPSKTRLAWGKALGNAGLMTVRLSQISPKA